MNNRWEDYTSRLLKDRCCLKITSSQDKQGQYPELQRISQQIVESLSKALTPNRVSRNQSQQRIVKEQQPIVVQQKLEKQQEVQSPSYINFRKYAREISNQPAKGIQQKKQQKVSRQRSQDFHNQQEIWMKCRNDKILQKRLEYTDRL
ncbi:hypothetical protein pb186bvf_020614 [Paramecium bursaria]